MTEERLNELLKDAGRTWMVPPEPDHEAMWSKIERHVFDRQRGAPRRPSWRILSLAMAAALVLGVGVGRFTSLTAPALPEVTSADTDSTIPASGYDRVASELLGRMVLLLTALPAEAGGVNAGEVFANQATELLSSTRLLLDSPAASDARFKNLLEDLELVLAQIAMLRSGRPLDEFDFITDALEERDVVPRIRSAAARLAAGD
ncbi:MAG TPA: hypothetical protein VF981_13840 [Gemmatimonadaceae bacterium]